VARSGSRSGSKRAKRVQKNVKKFHVLKGWMFSFEAKDFSLRLNVIHEGQGTK
jgi:hypothetical protein